MILMPICNLLCLLFITTFQLCESKDTNRNTQASFPFIGDYYKSSKFDPFQFRRGHKYKVRLYSKGSESYLRILGRKRIDSLGKMNSADTILIIENIAFGVIQIRGERSGLYLCMNKRGHLVGRKNLKTSRCAFIVEDDHPKAYKRYVSLACKSHRIAFNKNGRARPPWRVPNKNHRSVLFVEKKLYNEPLIFSMRTRRHGRRKMQDPCKKQNEKLLNKEWRGCWQEYCTQRNKKDDRSKIR